MKKLLLSILFLCVYSSCYGALVQGTNVGFVSSTPVGDPSATGINLDNFSTAIMDDTSGSINVVTEIGFWINQTPVGVFDAGIYAHDAGDGEPGAVIGSLSQDNTIDDADDGVWKNVSGLSISVSASTTYWIAIQIDNNIGTSCERQILVGMDRVFRTGDTALPSPWGDSTGTASGRVYGFYAVEDTVAPPVTGRRRIMISKYNPKFGCNVLGRYL